MPHEVQVEICDCMEQEDGATEEVVRVVLQKEVLLCLKVARFAKFTFLVFSHNRLSLRAVFFFCLLHFFFKYKNFLSFFLGGCKQEVIMLFL